MNSQRLEEIVAELMRPMRDLRHCFDTDLSALLEEYLTEAGLHALDAEAGDSSPAPAPAPRDPPPNFPELALLLQQSANIYGRKVDALYQHVLSVSDSLHNSIEMACEAGGGDSGEADEAADAASPARRKRPAPANIADFSYIPLVAAASARRDPGAARPPPTLPRMYIELEPRVLTEGDVPLRDYNGEPIGLMQDFQVNMPLKDGLLVDELEGPASGAGAIRPISLVELQAAIVAAAPPSPPPLREDSPPPDAMAAPDHCSTPLPSQEMPPPPPPPPAPLALGKKDRKRKHETTVEDLNGVTVKLLISKELRRALSLGAEYTVCAAWVARVVAQRRAAVTALRRQLRDRGDLPDTPDLKLHGFPGWPASEAMSASAVAAATRLRTGDDSDDVDDGFFEQSSHSSLDCDTQVTTTESEQSVVSGAEALEWAMWRARLAARAEAGGPGGRPLDVRAVAAAVLASLPADKPRQFTRVLAGTAQDDTDVSRLFLATLFLANAGNVEVIQGPPLSLNSFSVQLVTDDPRLYSAVAAAELPPPPPPPPR